MDNKVTQSCRRKKKERRLSRVLGSKKLVHCKITVNGNCNAEGRRAAQLSLFWQHQQLHEDDEDDPDTVGYICTINFGWKDVPKECPPETTFKFE